MQNEGTFTVNPGILNFIVDNKDKMVVQMPPTILVLVVVVILFG